MSGRSVHRDGHAQVGAVSHFTRPLHENTTVFALFRLKELAKLSSASEHTKIPEVMDHKCHVKLSEIALALLKIASYDLTTLSCPGLQK